MSRAFPPVSRNTTMLLYSSTSLLKTSQSTSDHQLSGEEAVDELQCHQKVFQNVPLFCQYVHRNKVWSVYWGAVKEAHQVLCWGWRPVWVWPWQGGWWERCSSWSPAELDTQTGSGRCAWLPHLEESRAVGGSAGSQSSWWPEEEEEEEKKEEWVTMRTSKGKQSSV